MLTEGSFIRDEWDNLLQLFNIMNDTTFSWSHSYSHSFLWDKCGLGKKEMKNPDGILFSMPRETESTVQKILEVSQRRIPQETESTREKSFRTSKTNSDTMKASRKYRSTLRRCTFRCGCDLWLHRCRQHCTWTRVAKIIWNYSRILNLRTSKVCSELRERWLKDIQNLRMYLPQTLRSSLWAKPVLLKEQAIKCTKARVHVYSDSVLCLGKQHGPEDAIRRWNDKVSTLKMCHTFRELQGLDGEPIDFEWKIFPGATALDISTKFKQTCKERTSHLKKSVIE